MYANDNLVCECFARSIYFLPGHYSMAKSLKIVNDEERDRELRQLKDSLVNIYNSIEKADYSLKGFLEAVKDTIGKLKAGGGSIKEIIGIKSFIRKNL